MHEPAVGTSAQTIVGWRQNTSWQRRYPVEKSSMGIPREGAKGRSAYRLVLADDEDVLPQASSPRYMAWVNSRTSR